MEKFVVMTWSVLKYYNFVKVANENLMESIFLCFWSQVKFKKRPHSSESKFSTFSYEHIIWIFPLPFYYRRYHYFRCIIWRNGCIVVVFYSYKVFNVDMRSLFDGEKFISILHDIVKECGK